MAATWTAVGDDSYFGAAWVCDLGVYIFDRTAGAPPVDYLPPDAGELDFYVSEPPFRAWNDPAGPFASGQRIFSSRGRNDDGTEYVSSLGALSQPMIDAPELRLIVVWYLPGFAEPSVPPDLTPEQVVPCIYVRGGRGPYFGPSTTGGHWSDWQPPVETVQQADSRETLLMRVQYGAGTISGDYTTAVAKARAAHTAAGQRLIANEFGTFTADGVDGYVEVYPQANFWGASWGFYAELNYYQAPSHAYAYADILAATITAPDQRHVLPNIIPPGVQGVDWDTSPITGTNVDFDGDSQAMSWDRWHLSTRPYGFEEVGSNSYPSAYPVPTHPAGVTLYESVRVAPASEVTAHSLGELFNSSLPTTGPQAAWIAARTAGTEVAQITQTTIPARPSEYSDGSSQTVEVDLSAADGAASFTVLFHPMSLTEPLPVPDPPPYADTYPDTSLYGATNFVDLGLHATEDHQQWLSGTTAASSAQLTPRPTLRYTSPRWRYWIPGRALRCCPNQKLRTITIQRETVPGSWSDWQPGYAVTGSGAFTSPTTGSGSSGVRFASVDIDHRNAAGGGSPAEELPYAPHDLRDLGAQALAAARAATPSDGPTRGVVQVNANKLGQYSYQFFGPLAAHFDWSASVAFAQEYTQFRLPNNALPDQPAPLAAGGLTWGNQPDGSPGWQWEAPTLTAVHWNNLPVTQYGYSTNSGIFLQDPTAVYDAATYTFTIPVEYFAVPGNTLQSGTWVDLAGAVKIGELNLQFVLKSGSYVGGPNSYQSTPVSGTLDLSGVDFTEMMIVAQAKAVRTGGTELFRDVSEIPQTGSRNSLNAYSYDMVADLYVTHGNGDIGGELFGFSGPGPGYVTYTAQTPRWRYWIPGDPNVEIPTCVAQQGGHWGMPLGDFSGARLTQLRKP